MSGLVKNIKTAISFYQPEIPEWWFPNFCVISPWRGGCDEIAGVEVLLQLPTVWNWAELTGTTTNPLPGTCSERQGLQLLQHAGVSYKQLPSLSTSSLNSYFKPNSNELIIFDSGHFLFWFNNIGMLNDEINAYRAFSPWRINMTEY